MAAETRPAAPRPEQVAAHRRTYAGVLRVTKIAIAAAVLLTILAVWGVIAAYS